MPTKIIHTKKVAILAAILIFISFINFNNSASTLASINQVGTVTVPFSGTASTSITIDGTISPGEYSNSFEDPVTSMTAYFTHNGTELFVGLVSPTLGWISIGFGPEGTGMSGSNIIIGYVDGGTVVMEDFYGNAGWSHTVDTDLGGFDDIVAFDGTENATYTVMEFAFPLSSGDSKDHSFFEGEMYGFFLGHHPTADDLTSTHSAHSDLLSLYIEMSFVIMPVVSDSQVTVDGIVDVDEYKGYVKDPVTNISLYLQHDLTNMYIALVSPDHPGWVGIGFGPKGVGMDGANIIIGYVENDTDLAIADNYGVPDNHFSDVSDGGTDDIVDSAGTENPVTNTTTIEFIYPLNTSDIVHDYNFSLGETYGFYLSNADEDDFVAMHPEHSATIDLYISPREHKEVTITFSVTDGEGNQITEGASLEPESTIIIKANVTLKDNNESVAGSLVHLYSNSTFGLSQIETNITDTSGYTEFSPDLSVYVGKIDFIVEFPVTTMGTVLISQSRIVFTVDIITPHFEEEPYYWDNPAVFVFITMIILVAAGGIFATYLFVFFNAGRIFSRKKSPKDRNY
ncbi:MAG: DOMON domain-containing protein [Candidatus Hodarchaeales archaeon]